ncbi:hypothetical protein FRB93_010527 [Tulasnella sp. JGI-2019a]|nr:hypothetical protein FRB93_010527 [Tulasnella sp. JGI-2019a]
MSAWQQPNPCVHAAVPTGDLLSTAAPTGQASHPPPMTPAGTGNPVPPGHTAPAPLRTVDVFAQLEPSGTSHLDSDHDMQPQDRSPRPSRSQLPTTRLGSARNSALDVDLDPTPLPCKEKRTFLVAADSPSFKASTNAKSRKTGKATAKPTLSAEEYEVLAEQKKLECTAEKEADQDILREFGLPTTQVVKQSICYIKPITSDEVDRYASHLWNGRRKPSLTCLPNEDYRYNPSSKYLEKLKDHPLALHDFCVMLNSGLTWMWVTVYNCQHPDDANAEMLLSAIRYRILMKNLPQSVGKDLEAKIYKRPNGSSIGTICLFCSKAAKDLLAAEFTIFAFHEKGIDCIFFLQGPKSWGQRIVLDITNSPTVLSELVKGINNSLKDIIKLNKEGKPSSLCITHLDWVNPSVAPGITPRIIVNPKQVRTGNCVILNLPSLPIFALCDSTPSKCPLVYIQPCKACQVPKSTFVMFVHSTCTP